jgi:hypothetical protein
MQKRISLTFLLCATIHISTTCMQLTRVAKKSSAHKVRSVKRYTATTPQKENISEKKKTIIRYQGNNYTPAEFAHYATELAIAKGVNYIQSQCANNKKDEMIACTCIKPYLIVPIDSPVHMSDQSALKNEPYSETLMEVMERLNIALDHFKDDKQVLAKLREVQNKLCPNLQKCKSTILDQDHKKLKKEVALVGKKVAVWGLMLYAGGSCLNITSFGAFTVGFFIAAQYVAPNNLSNYHAPQTKIMERAMERHVISQKNLISSVLEEVSPMLPQNPSSTRL